ncbi:3-keto-5-aminohexanoate cleavage protein [Membranicola marinus]|uniref:3-keto-5-aminohexanoate cleavage protein n=1 Tax=Membranihabitans marinus TaxID=1227546 RepID=A0A953HUQ6_9BACT|nr:3-keto-5-aminohexanoate cleavage protein [Membranihabitans marinus]MBY5956851.1 3-keto-5-aminohexanoate cleavage protein [Membranihabitans marinus]
MSSYIINFTPTGMVPTKDHSVHVPIAPQEIIDEVLEAREYGISIVHLHARDAEGKPTWKKEIYQEIIEGIRKEEGSHHEALIICVSASGRNWPDFERRSECMDLNGGCKPDMASLTLSSLNFTSGPSTNSPEMIQKLATKMLRNGIKPELEVFDPGMINYAKYLHKKGIIKPPFYFNIILGNIASSQAGLLDVGYLLSQLPPQSYWSLGGIGASQLKMNTTGLVHGGGVRVGLEDNLYYDAQGTQLATNIQLLKRITEIGRLLGSEPYSPGEARKILGLN